MEKPEAPDARFTSQVMALVYLGKCIVYAAELIASKLQPGPK